MEASIEDGVLRLKIYCGKIYELDDEETIFIRWNKFREEQTTPSQVFFLQPPPHPHSSSALFFDRTLSFGCLRALRWISEVCCVFLIYTSSSPCSLASSSFLQHFKLFSSIKISKRPQIRISSESLKSFNPKIFNQLLSPLSQIHFHNCVLFIFTDI